MLSLNKIGRNLLKISSSTLPKSPKTCAEIIDALENENVVLSYGMTQQNGENVDGLSSKPFFKKAFECKDFAYCIFVSDNIVDGIKKIPVARRNFLMDATFKVCPFGQFNQLLIIYVEHLEEVILSK